MTSEPAPKRTDARRNYEALLEAGREIFITRGAEAAFDEVAARAGVGKGTLYRHFPSREHLAAGILSRDFTRLADSADALIASDVEPYQALITWLEEFDETPMRYPGIRPYLEAGITSADTPVSTACSPMKHGADTLLRRAQETGAVRSDIQTNGLLAMIAAVPGELRSAGKNPYLDLLLRGLAPDSAH